MNRHAPALDGNTAHRLERRGSGRIAGLESFGSVSVTEDATVLALAPATRLSSVFAHLEQAGIPASAVQLARPDLEDLFLLLPPANPCGTPEPPRPFFVPPTATGPRSLLRKDIVGFLRDRTAVSLTFLVPAVLISTLSRCRSSGSIAAQAARSGFPLAVRGAGPDFGGGRRHHRLPPTGKGLSCHDHGKRRAGRRNRPDRRPGPRAPFRENKLRYALVFPGGCPEYSSFGLKVRFLNNPRNDISNPRWSRACCRKRSSPPRPPRCSTRCANAR